MSKRIAEKRRSRVRKRGGGRNGYEKKMGKGAKKYKDGRMIKQSECQKRRRKRQIRKREAQNDVWRVVRDKECSRCNAFSANIYLKLTKMIV